VGGGAQGGTEASGGKKEWASRTTKAAPKASPPAGGWGHLKKQGERGGVGSCVGQPDKKKKKTGPEKGDWGHIKVERSGEERKAPEIAVQTPQGGQTNWVGKGQKIK